MLRLVLARGLRVFPNHRDPADRPVPDLLGHRLAPASQPAEYRLRVKGSSTGRSTLTYADLLAMPPTATRPATSSA